MGHGHSAYPSMLGFISATVNVLIGVLFHSYEIVCKMIWEWDFLSRRDIFNFGVSQKNFHFEFTHNVYHQAA